MHFIIYGSEGSGKGTQAKKLGFFYHLPVITSGDLVREMAVKDKSKIGEICKSALLNGQYVEDKVMFTLWKNKLNTSTAKKGFILDGFPRNVTQAQFLLKEVEKAGYRLNKVIYLNIGDEEAIKRLVKRRREVFKGSKESHDTPERIKKRLHTFREQEVPLIQFFREKELLLEIDGEKSEDRVFEKIIQELKERK